MSAEAFPLVRIRGSLGAAGQTENSLAELRRSPILRSWTYALRASANFGKELAPIGSDYECETGTDPPSSRETSTLPDKGGSPCHAPSTPHQAHLATVFGLAAAKGDEPSALLPPPRHPDSVISRVLHTDTLTLRSRSEPRTPPGVPDRRDPGGAPRRRCRRSRTGSGR